MPAGQAEARHSWRAFPMTRLSQHDQELVLATLRELYAEMDLGALRVLMLRLVSRLVANDWASYNEVDRDDLRSLVNIRIPDAAEIRQHAPGLFACIEEHPSMRTQPTGTFDSHTISDFLSWRDFQRTRMFNDYYRHVGVRDQLFFNFDGGEGPWRGIALNRKRQNFSPRDRAVLNLLSAHFGQAHANAIRFDRLYRAAPNADAPLAIPTEMKLTLDGALRIMGLSDAGRRWLVVHVGVRLGEGAVPPEPLLGWVRGEVSRRTRPDFLEGPGASFRLTGSKGTVTVRFAGREPDGRTHLFFRAAVPETARRESGRPELTARENEVLKWIALGKSNPEIAIILGLSVRTVYKHVENIFAKLGVETRAQAMILALERR